MVYQGRIDKDGVLVLEGGVTLPEGARVRVEVQEDGRSSTATPATLSDTLGDLIGSVKGWPPDMARNHDHYLHGAPKRD